MSDYILTIGAQLDASFDKAIAEAKSKIQSLLSSIGNLKLNIQVDSNKIKDTVKQVNSELEKFSKAKNISFNTSDIYRVGLEFKNWDNLLKITNNRLQDITKQSLLQKNISQDLKNSYFDWKNAQTVLNKEILFSNSLFKKSNDELRQILNTTRNWNDLLKLTSKERNRLITSYKNEIISAKEYTEQLKNINKIENLIYNERFKANKENIKNKIEEYVANQKYIQALNYINKETQKIRELSRTGKIDFGQQQKMLEFLRSKEREIYTQKVASPINIYSLENIKNIATYNSLLKSVRENINKITQDYASGKITLKEYSELLSLARERQQWLLTRRNELLAGLQSQASTVLSTYGNLTPMINMVKSSMEQLTTAYLSGNIASKQYIQQTKALREQLTQLRTANVLVGNSFWSLVSAFGRTVLWTTAGMSVYWFITSIMSLGESIKNIDKETKNLNKILREEIDIWGKVIDVTNEAKLAYSRLELGEMGRETAAGLEKSLKTQIDFVRAGFSLVESIELTKSALMSQNVAEMSVTESTKAFIAVMQQFNLNAFQSIEILNKWNEITNKIGSSTKDLAASVERAGSTWLLANKNMQSSFTTLNAITVAIQKSTGRAGGEIGTAIRSISVNYMDLAKKGTTVADVLRTVGIEIMKNKNEYKPLIEVLSGLAGKWRDLSEVQKANISRVFAMKWHYSTFNALLNSFNQVTLAVVAQLRSANSAYKENQIYLERLDARINLLKVSWEKVVLGPGSAFLNLLKGLIDILRYFLTGLSVLPSNIMLIIGAIVVLLGYLNTLKNTLLGLGLALSVASKLNWILAGLQIAFVAGAIAIGKYKDAQEEASMAVERQIEIMRQQNNLLKETGEVLPFLISEYKRVAEATDKAKKKIDELKNAKINIRINAKDVIENLNQTMDILNDSLKNKTVINLQETLKQKTVPEQTIKFNAKLEGVEAKKTITDINELIDLKQPKIKFEADNTDTINKINEINQQIYNQSKIYRDNMKVRVELEKYFNEIARTLNIRTYQEYVKINKNKMSLEKATGEYIKQVQTAIRNKTIQTNIEIARSYLKLAAEVSLSGSMVISSWDLVVATFWGTIKSVGMTIYNLFVYIERGVISSVQNILGGLKNVITAVNNVLNKTELTVTINALLAGINALERMKLTPINWGEVFSQGSKEVDKIINQRYQTALLKQQEYYQKALQGFGLSGLQAAGAGMSYEPYSGATGTGKGAGERAKKDASDLKGVGGALENIIEKWVELKKKIKEGLDANKDFIKTFDEYSDANLKLKELRSNFDMFKDLNKIFGLKQQQSLLEKTLVDLTSYFKEKNTSLQQIYKDVISKEVNLNNELKRTSDEFYGIEKSILSVTTAIDNLFSKANQSKNLKTEELQNLIMNLKEVAGISSKGLPTSKGISGYTWKQMGLKTVGTDIITKDVKGHKYSSDILATDFGAKLGTDIKSLTQGIVVFAGALGDYGNAVKVLYKDIDNTYKTVLYAHLKDIKVKTNQIIKEGEVLGTVGSTGKSTGPHLHLEFRKATDNLIKQYKLTQNQTRFALSKIIEQELTEITKKYPKWTSDVEQFKKVLQELKESVIKEFSTFKGSQEEKNKLIEQTIKKYNELRQTIEDNQKQVLMLDTVINVINNSLNKNNIAYTELADNIEKNSLLLIRNKLEYAKLGLEFDNTIKNIENLNETLNIHNKQIELLEDNAKKIKDYQSYINTIDFNGLDNIANVFTNIINKINKSIQEIDVKNVFVDKIKNTVDTAGEFLKNGIKNINSYLKEISINKNLLKQLGFTDEQIASFKELNQEQLNYIKTILNNIETITEKNKIQVKESILNVLLTKQTIEKTREQNKNSLILDELKKKELEYSNILLKQNIILENTGISRQFKIEQLNILNKLLDNEIQKLNELNKIEQEGKDVLSNKLQTIQKINEYQGQILSITKEINKLPQIIQTASDEINNLIYDSINIGILDLLKNREKEILSTTETLTNHLKSREEILKSIRSKIVPLSEAEQFRNEITNTIEELKKSFIEEKNINKQLEMLKNPFIRLKEYLEKEFAPKTQEIFTKAIMEGITEGLQIKQVTSDFIKQIFTSITNTINSMSATNNVLENTAEKIAGASATIASTQLSNNQQETRNVLSNTVLSSITATIASQQIGDILGTILQGGQRKEGSNISSLIGGILGGLVGSFFGLPGTFIGGGLGSFIGSFLGGDTETSKYIKEQNEALYKSVRALQENTRQLINLNDTYKSIRDITAEIIPAPASAYYSGRIAPTDLNIKVNVETNDEMFSARVTEITSNQMFNASNLMRWF